MGAHRIAHDLFRAPLRMNDPGDGKTITADRNLGSVPLVTGASGETRTLSRPTKSGVLLAMGMHTDGGGDCVVTVTGGYDQAGNTDLTFGDAGDVAVLLSFEVGDETYYWRLIGFDGISGPTVEISELDIDNLAISGATTAKAGAAVAAVAHRFGASETEGLEIKVYDETIELTNTVSVDTNCVLPAGAVILSVQANLEATITGDGSGDDLLATIGIGISGDDEDAYAETAALTANSKADAIQDWAVLSAETTLAIFALKADGDTACTEKFTGGSGQDVRVRVVYAACNSLDDAA